VKRLLALGTAVVTSLLLVLGTAGSVLAVQPRPPRPAVLAVSVRPAKLGYAGGEVRIVASVARATECEVSASPPVHGYPKTVPCSKGLVSTVALLPKNPTKVPRRQVFYVQAMTAGSRPASATTDVMVEPIFTWTGSAEPPAGGGTGTGTFTGVSCTSTTFCIAVDENSGAALTWDGSSWSEQAQPPVPPDEVACLDSTFCMASDGHGFLTYDGSSWSAHASIFRDPNQALRSVGCASDTLCAGASWFAALAGWDGTGRVVGPQLDPVGNAGGYTNVPTAVTCATDAFCIVYDASGWMSTFNGSSWTTPSRPLGTALDAVACASADYCLARVGTSQAVFDGTEWSSLEPADSAQVDFGFLFCQTSTSCEAIGSTAEVYDGSRWATGPAVTLAVPNPWGWAAASCTSTTFCMAAANDGYAIKLNPSQAPAPLTTSPVPVPPGGYLNSISCPKVSWCLAVDASGAFVTGAATSWSIPAYAEAGVPLSAVSCTSSSSCVAVDSDGNAIEFDGTKWSAPVSVTTDAGGLTAVSCVADGAGSSTTAFCVAVDGSGNAFELNGGSWSTATSIDSGAALMSVSCTASDFCVAGGADGNVITYDGTWGTPLQVITDQYPYDDAIESVSCTSGTFCAAVDENGDASVYDNSAWSPQVLVGDVDAVSCAATRCIAAGISAAYSFSGSAWSKVTDPLGLQDAANAVSCGSSTVCVGVYGGAALGFNDGSLVTEVSADTPGQPVQTSCPTQDFCAAFDGNYAYVESDGIWSAPTLLPPYSGAGFSAAPSLSCTGPSFCVAIDGPASYIWNGQLWSYMAIASDGSASDLMDVSCASADFCVAVGGGYDSAFEYKGSSWSPMGAGFGTDVSCVSSMFCMAVGPYTDPPDLFNGSTWEALSAPDTYAQQVSCTSPTFCMAFAYYDDGTSQTDDVATWDGTRWTPSSALPSAPSDVSPVSTLSCVSSDFCMADNAVWNGVVWSEPGAFGAGEIDCVSTTFCVQTEGSAYPGPPWSATVSFDPSGLPVLVDVAPHSELTAIGCSAPGLCLGVDNQGQAVTLANGSWSSPETVDKTVGFIAVSCVAGTRLWCAATDNLGGVFVDNEGQWSLWAVLPSPQLENVSCPGSSFCMVVAVPSATGTGPYLDSVYSVTSSGWTSEGSLNLGFWGLSLSCPTQDLCAASSWDTVGIGSGGGPPYTRPIDLWQDGVWSVQTAVSIAGQVSCVSASFCLMAGAKDSDGNFTAYQTFDGTGWSAPSSAPGMNELSCATTEFCVGLGGSDATAFNGTSWTTPVEEADGQGLTSLNCPTVTYCAALGQDNAVFAASG